MDHTAHSTVRCSGIAGFVGELAEVHLVGMAGTGQHANIGPGTKDPILGRAQQNHFNLRVLKP